MNRYVTVTCYKCGQQWTLDREREQAQRVIYRGDQNTRVETYLVTCPKCGVQVVVEVTIEAGP